MAVVAVVVPRERAMGASVVIVALWLCVIVDTAPCVTAAEAPSVDAATALLDDTRTLHTTASHFVAYGTGVSPDGTGGAARRGGKDGKGKGSKGHPSLLHSAAMDPQAAPVVYGFVKGDDDAATSVADRQKDFAHPSHAVADCGAGANAAKSNGNSKAKVRAAVTAAMLVIRAATGRHRIQLGSDLSAAPSAYGVPQGDVANARTCVLTQLATPKGGPAYIRGGTNAYPFAGMSSEAGVDAVMWLHVIDASATLGDDSATAIATVQAQRAMGGKAVQRHAREWDWLGPFPVGKLELDGDPAAAHPAVPHRRATAGIGAADVIHPAIRASPDLTYPSELAAGGHVRWAPVEGSASDGSVSLAPRVDWNTHVRTLTAREVLEFQGWLVRDVLVAGVTSDAATESARPAYARRYIVSCAGVNTVYLDGTMLAADQYGRGTIAAVVSLRPGVHTLAIRVRATVQAAIRCSVALAKPPSGEPEARAEAMAMLTAPMVHDPAMLPDVVDGVLFTSYLAVPTLNTAGAWLRDVSIEVEPVQRRGAAAAVFVAAHTHQERLFDLAPGQFAMLPLRLALSMRRQDHVVTTCDTDEKQQARAISDIRYHLLSAGGDVAQALAFRYRVVASAAATDGAEVTIKSEWVSSQLRQRAVYDAFLLSFVDHDGSVQQAAAVAPKTPAPSSKAYPATRRRMQASPGVGRGTGAHADADTDAGIDADGEALQVPVMVSQHGTGVTAQSQVEAYKFMRKSASEYEFGVAGAWLLAPTRHGAHNWEGQGYWTVVSALDALETAVSGARAVSGALARDSSGEPRIACDDAVTRSGSLLCVPHADTRRVIWAGHSMGGHGALHAAIRQADRALLVAPAAGWLSKEQYGESNSWQRLDVANAWVDPGLAGILAAAFHENNADVHAPNLRGLSVHMRVGANDATVPVWYSHRMARVLGASHVHTYSYAQPDIVGALGFHEEDGPGNDVIAADGMTGHVPGGHGGSVVVEEVEGMEHWWWDTHSANDGGVLNDKALRRLYKTHLSGSSVLSPAAPLAVCSAGDNGAPQNHIPSGDPVFATPLPGLARQFQLVVHNPSSFESRGGIAVIQQQVTSRLSTVTVDRVVYGDACEGAAVFDGLAYACAWRLTTRNVRRLRILPRSDVHESLRVSQISIDGEGPIDLYRSAACNSVDLCRATPRGGATACNADVSTASDAHVACHNQAVTKPRWHVCRRGGEPDSYMRTERGPKTYGPAREVIARPFIVVVGTVGDDRTSSVHMDAARYLALSNAMAGDSLVWVARDVELSAEDVRGHNLVLLGGPSTNAWTARLYDSEREANATHDGGIRVAGAMPVRFRAYPGVAIGTDGECDHRGPGIGVVSTFGMWHSSSADDSGKAGTAQLGLVIAGTDVAGLTSAMELAVPTIPPMTRVPLSNAIPDFVVVGPELRTQGAGGIRAAGFYDAQWRYAAASSWCADPSPTYA